MGALKQLRLDAGRGFRETCRALGIAESHLSRWEHGTYSPSSRYVKPLATFYGVSTDAVLDAIERQRQAGNAVSSGHG